MDNSLKEFQLRVIEALNNCLDNASFDGEYYRISSEITESLGECLSNLAGAEERRYRQYLTENQTGLSAAQVALQRLNMKEAQLQIERKIDLADQFYLALFDSKQGNYYVSHSDDGVRFIERESFEQIKHN